MKTLVLLLLVVIIQDAVKPSEATFTYSRKKGLGRKCALLSRVWSPLRGKLLRQRCCRRFPGLKGCAAVTSPTWKRWTRKPIPTWKPWTGKPFLTWKPWTRKPFLTWKPWTRKPFLTWKPWTRKPIPTRRPWTQKPTSTLKPMVTQELTRPTTRLTTDGPISTTTRVTTATDRPTSITTRLTTTAMPFLPSRVPQSPLN